jgi:innexin
MTVFGMLSAVAGLIKVRFLVEKAIIDNMVFRMHYRLTSTILFASCLIVTANSLIGKVPSFNFSRIRSSPISAREF